ncbi:hypothetical protein Dhaf_3172 [Desulfitobacterium hafniense DCB-2]|uniref:Uncharacterized protein n=1 Tax=Desulfitobacterium hafniense (strain DSM 10664 / DCB-2) TaxID=272564 RepID=B8G1E2_DESHD|nr:hypothetical protein [Desulfitobacterium hafniense]ACL21195.1 hypothetical protein Dhaf_3172 [Desulfitobacterium hafniense DCB-2]
MNNTEIETKIKLIEENITMIGQTLGLIAEKLGVKHRFIYALFSGISFQELDDMMSLIIAAKNSDILIGDLINNFNEKFPRHKNGIVQIIQCCKEEQMFLDFCNKFLNSPEVKRIMNSYPEVCD